MLLFMLLFMPLLPGEKVGMRGSWDQHLMKMRLRALTLPSPQGEGMFHADLFAPE
jgi:hypothetical protein